MTDMRVAKLNTGLSEVEGRIAEMNIELEVFIVLPGMGCELVWTNGDGDWGLYVRYMKSCPVDPSQMTIQRIEHTSLGIKLDASEKIPKLISKLEEAKRDVSEKVEKALLCLQPLIPAAPCEDVKKPGSIMMTMTWDVLLGLLTIAAGVGVLIRYFWLE